MAQKWHADQDSYIYGRILICVRKFRPKRFRKIDSSPKKSAAEKKPRKSAAGKKESGAAPRAVPKKSATAKPIAKTNKKQLSDYDSGE
jgi:hypothetical protein